MLLFFGRGEGDLGGQYHGMGIGMMERVFLSKPAAFFFVTFSQIVSALTGRFSKRWARED